MTDITPGMLVRLRRGAPEQPSSGYGWRTGDVWMVWRLDGTELLLSRGTCGIVIERSAPYSRYAHHDRRVVTDDKHIVFIDGSFIRVQSVLLEEIS